MDATIDKESVMQPPRNDTYVDLDVRTQALQKDGYYSRSWHRNSATEERTTLRLHTYEDGRKRLVRFTARKLQGVTKDGKKWCRWRTDSIIIWRVCKDGQVVKITSDRTQNMRQRAFYSSTEIVDDDTPELLEHLGAQATRDLMPLLPVEFLRRIHYVPSVMRHAYAGAMTPGDLTINLFGRRRYRKDLVKAVAASEPHNLYLAWQLRTVVPVDWLVAMLRHNSPNTRFTDLRKVIRRLDESTLRRLCLRPQTSAYATDIVRMASDDQVLAEALARSPRTWDELHDALSITHRAMMRCQQAQAHRQMWEDGEESRRKHFGELVKLDCATHGDISLHLPTSVDDLLRWSDELHNCISGYVSPVSTGSSLIMAVHRDREIIGALEIRTTGQARLMQLLGHRNQNLDQPVQDAVLALLEPYDVSVERYGGATR